jgi:hypothetical protein
MMATKLKNEYGFKNSKFSVSVNLTTVCDSFEAPIVMVALGCNNPDWALKDRNISEKTVGSELHQLICNTIYNYFNGTVGMPNALPTLPKTSRRENIRPAPAHNAEGQIITTSLLG